MDLLIQASDNYSCGLDVKIGYSYIKDMYLTLKLT